MGLSRPWGCALRGGPRAGVPHIMKFYVASPGAEAPPRGGLHKHADSNRQGQSTRPPASQRGQVRAGATEIQKLNVSQAIAPAEMRGLANAIALPRYGQGMGDGAGGLHA